MNPQHSAAEIKPKLRDFDEMVAVTRGSLCLSLIHCMDHFCDF